MSGKSPRRKTTRQPDRRIQRTRDALGDALIALMQEKPFDSITIDNVLKRANVSRTTFYTHYLHKEDLFLSDVEEFFEACSTALERSSEQSRRVAPVRELFAHVASAEHFYVSLAASPKFHDVMEIGCGLFARGIERRLATLGAHKNVTPAIRTAISEGLAGALFAMLTAWMRRNHPESPEAMDDAFHRLVWPNSQ